MLKTGSDGGVNRRRFLQGGAAIAGATLSRSLFGEAAIGSQGIRQKRPNIVFFYNEGQRADSLSMLNTPFAVTPNMDRIAREGAYFSNSFCTNALCAPARAVALTGLNSHTSGALDNKTKDPIPLNTPFFTDLLQREGYRTAMIGKAHFGNGGKERNWDYYFAFNAAVTSFTNPRIIEGRRGHYEAEKTFRGVYTDDLITDNALAWLEEESDQPFCLLLWQQAPHAPFFRPRRYLDDYNGAAVAKPATFDDDKKGYPGKPKAFAEAENKIGTFDTTDAIRSLEELVKDYYAGLHAVDDNIGRILQYLDDKGLTNDTLVIVSSDHGYFLGEWRCFDKRFMHEPSLRTPTLMRFPRHIKPGSRVDDMMLNLDFAPTILEFAGVSVPDSMQGTSTVPLLTGAKVPWRKDFLYEYFAYPGAEQVRPHRGIRTERYKYIHYYLDPAEYELYDLHNDPGELHNLYGKKEYADLTAKLEERLSALRKESHDTTTDRTI